MTKLGIHDLPLAGKKILIRVDYNVPLNKDGTIADDTRIRESLATINYALKEGAAVVLMSHLGTPQSKQDLQYSLGICAKRLSQLISAPVFFAPDCTGKTVDRMIQNLKGGEILLLENLRFHAAEQDPDLDPNFAKELAKGIDYYVNDAFGTSHRKHTSITAIQDYFPGKAAMGLLMQKEISFLSSLLNHPDHPFYVILGGVKVSSKIKVLKSLLSVADAFFLGGGMALPFLKCKGVNLGSCFIEMSHVQIAEEFLNECQKKEKEVYLPLDLVIADQLCSDAIYKMITIDTPVPNNWSVVDIGPLTLEGWKPTLQKGATLFWNGPVGVYEIPSFAHGTERLAQILSQVQGTTVIGGGDSVAAIRKLHLESKFSHLSTGGGASLEYLEQGQLPGITALSEKNGQKWY